MKLSKYNYLKKIGSDTIFFNGMTCALAIVDENFLRAYDELQQGVFDASKYDRELVNNMRDSGCFIEDSVDELRLLEFYKNAAKYDKTSLALTIAPTLECNFRCKYCFEKHKQGVMSDETQNALVSFVREKLAFAKELSITWYGGEPLLARDIVYSLSERFLAMIGETNTSFSAFIITNASLMTSSDIDAFKKYHIDGAQITIDGPREVHDARRKHISGESTFDKLIENVNALLDAGIRVIVRINIDKDNLDRMEDLLRDLKERIRNYEKLQIDFGKVAVFTDVCKSVENSCFSTEQYAEVLLPLYGKVMEMGFSMNKMTVYPSLRFNYCCADYMNSYVIDVEGDIYKCWNDVGRPGNKCGNVKDKEIGISHKYLDWIQWNPLNVPKCRECNLLPICGGGCPSMALQQDDNSPVCDAVKYNLENVLRFTYNQLRKEENK